MSDGYKISSRSNKAGKSEQFNSYEPSENNSHHENLSDRYLDDETKKKHKQEMASQLKKEFGSILSWGGDDEKK